MTDADHYLALLLLNFEFNVDSTELYDLVTTVTVYMDICLVNTHSWEFIVFSVWSVDTEIML